MPSSPNDIESSSSSEGDQFEGSPEQAQQGALGYQPPEDAAEYDSGFGQSTSEAEQFQADDLMDALRDAQPDWATGPQPNAAGYQPPDGTDSADKYPHSFSNRTDYSAPFPEALPVDTTTEDTPQVAQIFAFAVATTTEKNTGRAGLSIYPGWIETVIPTINGTGLDANPAPVFFTDSISEDFEVTLKITIGLNPQDNYRYSIVSAEINEGQDEPPLQITWTDEASGAGYFFLKIADCFVNSTTQKVSKINQYLFNSVRNFAFAVDEVIILS